MRKSPLEAAEPSAIRIKRGDTDALPMRILRDSSEHIYNPKHCFEHMLEDDVLADAGVPGKLRMPQFIDLAISENALAEMRITLSPAISAGNRVIVEDLAAKYLEGLVGLDSGRIIEDSAIHCVW